MARNSGSTTDRFHHEATKKRDKRVREQEIDDLVYVLKTKAGRRLIFRLLEKSHCFSSIYADGSKIFHNAGWQDSGMFLSGECQEASIEHFFLMLQEGLTANQRTAIELLTISEGLRKEAVDRGETIEEDDL